MICFDVILIGIEPKFTRFSGILYFRFTNLSNTLKCLMLFHYLRLTEVFVPEIFRDSLVEKICRVKKFSTGACVLPYQTTSPIDVFDTVQ